MSVATMPEITFESSWDRKTGLCLTTVRDGDKLIHADKLDPASAADRMRFVAHVRNNFPGLEVESIEDELLRLADVQSKGTQTPQPIPIETVTDLRAESWPEKMDQEAFHGIAGEIVQLIAPQTEADPVAILISFLVGFGNIVGRTAYFLADGARHHANIFAVLVGQTSKGRKGTSWNQVARILRHAAAAWMVDCVQRGLSSGEGLIWAVRDPITVKKSKSRREAETVEVTEDAGVEDKRLLALETEFALVLRVLEREGNSLSAIIRQAWDSGDMRTLTKNSPARATGAHVSILGHITREELRRYLSDTEMANGFGNRFTWFCVRRSQYLPDGGNLSDESLETLTKKVAQVLAFALEEREIRRDKDAKAMWHSVYPKLSGDRSGLFGFLTSRAEAQVMRFALIFALLDRSSLIRTEHLLAALAVWEYVEASVRHLFGSSLGDPVADAILRALRQTPMGLTRTEISNVLGRNTNAGRLNAALRLLVESDHVTRTLEQTQGRSAERWFAKVSATKETK